MAPVHTYHQPSIYAVTKACYHPSILPFFHPLNNNIYMEQDVKQHTNGLITKLRNEYEEGAESINELMNKNKNGNLLLYLRFVLFVSFDFVL